MIYSTVFQVVPSAGPVGVGLADVVPGAAAAILFVKVRSRSVTLDRRLQIVGYTAAVVLALLTLWSVADSQSRETSATKLAKAVQAGKGHIVEGQVEDFVRGSNLFTKVPESFVVSGVSFHYAEWLDSGGFNQTAETGGPVHSGLQVRIEYVSFADVFPSSAYVGNVITRLEVPVPGT